MESKLGEGSVFHIVIPFEVGQNVTETETRSLGTGVAPAQLSGIRVLVAEDNLINQKVVRNTLSKQGAEVTITSNGQEAIDQLQQDAGFDVVLMDLQMPEVDGYKATRHIRGKLGLTLPIIAMTADALKGEAEKCFEAGMNAYVSKPFDPQDLYQQILKVVKEDPQQEQTTEYRQHMEQPLIDLSYLNDLSGNDPAYIYEVIDLFLSTTPDGLNKLEHLIRNTDDWDAIYKQAHFLKSSVSVIRIRDMYDGLARIEALARERQGRDEIERILDGMVATFKEAHVALLEEKERNKPSQV